MARRIPSELESQIVELLKVGYSPAQVAIAVDCCKNTVRACQFRHGGELRGIDSRLRELLDDDLELFHAREYLTRHLKSKVA